MKWCDPKLIKLSDKDSTSETASGPPVDCGSGSSDDFCSSGGVASSYCNAGGSDGG